MDSLRSVFEYSKWCLQQQTTIYTIIGGRSHNQVSEETRRVVKNLGQQMFTKMNQLLSSDLSMIDKKRVLVRFSPDFIEHYAEKFCQNKELLKQVMDTPRSVSEKQRMLFEEKAQYLIEGDGEFYLRKLNSYRRKLSSSQSFVQVQRYQAKYAEMVLTIENSKLTPQEKNSLIKGTYIKETEDDFLDEAPHPKKMIVPNPSERSAASRSHTYAIPAAAQAHALESAQYAYDQTRPLKLKAPLRDNILRMAQEIENIGALAPTQTWQPIPRSLRVDISINDESSMSLACRFYVARINDMYKSRSNQDVIVLSNILGDIDRGTEITPKEKRALLLKIREEDFAFGLSVLDGSLADRLTLLYNLEEPAVMHPLVPSRPIEEGDILRKQNVEVEELKGNPYYQFLRGLYVQLLQSTDEDSQMEIQMEIMSLREQISNEEMSPEVRNKLLATDYESIARQAVLNNMLDKNVQK
jgi:hypothetical protein